MTNVSTYDPGKSVFLPRAVPCILSQGISFVRKVPVLLIMAALIHNVLVLCSDTLLWNLESDVCFCEVGVVNACKDPVSPRS